MMPQWSYYTCLLNNPGQGRSCQAGQGCRDKSVACVDYQWQAQAETKGDLCVSVSNWQQREAGSGHLQLIFSDNKSGLFLSWRGSTEVFLFSARQKPEDEWPGTFTGWPRGLSHEKSRAKTRLLLITGRAVFIQTCEHGTALQGHRFKSHCPLASKHRQPNSISLFILKF